MSTSPNRAPSSIPLRDHWSSSLARLLDDAITIPGTSIRIGLDPVIGLLPGIGDALGALLGGLIVYGAARMGAPKRVLVKMLGNVMLDYLGGILPIVGDLFDVAFHSNRRNVELLRSISEQDWGQRRNGQAVGRLVGLTALVLFSLLVFAIGGVVFMLLRALTG